MTYRAALAYLDSFINYEKQTAFAYKQSFKLDRIRDFLRLLGNPQAGLKCIHVAGTKGKGSTCAFAAYILRSSGYRVGLYTSPHLCSVRERIRILAPARALSRPGTSRDFEGMISASGLAKLVSRLKPVIDAYSRSCRYGPLSFFEVYTALALVYFRQQNVDYAVLETGMGGRLDATNAVDAAICCITPISYDHTNKLGSTLAAIAAEKAGIIKARVPVICAPQPQAALAVIRRKCRRQRAALFEIGKDILIVPGAGRGRQSFGLNGRFGAVPDLAVRISGSHQIVNAAAAVSLVKGLCSSGLARTSAAALRRGLAQTRWPGRCETVSRAPLIMLDGAHNQASARMLRQTLNREFAQKQIILVLGISQDKDIAGICRELVPVSRAVVLTQADNPRAMASEEIYSRQRALFSRTQATITHGIRRALSLARRQSRMYRRPLIVVTGSLFVVGEARSALLKRKAGQGID
jgi:dihydrofolate synthase/folylpolyglutamate synthase